MSQCPRHLIMMEAVHGGLFCNSGSGEQRDGWHDDRKLRDKMAASLDAAINSHASTARIFGFPNSRVEKFGYTDAIENLLAHSHSPAFYWLGKQQNTTSTNKKQNSQSAHYNSIPRRIVFRSDTGTPVDLRSAA